MFIMDKISFQHVVWRFWIIRFYSP